jgi:hypothetical protein
MRWVLGLAGVLWLTIAVDATVIVPIEFRELVLAAPVILHGQVAEVRGGWAAERRSVETFVTIAVADYLKGDLGPSVVVRVPGGQLGRYRTVFVGAPEFQRGEEVVLFLNPASAAYPYIIGLSQGAFRVLADARSGQRMVTTAIVMGKGGDPPERVVRGDPSRKPLTIDAFRGAVRQVLAQRAGQ